MESDRGKSSLNRIHGQRYDKNTVATKMEHKLHYFYSWSALSRARFRAVVREFLDNGADRFVIDHRLLGRMIDDPELVCFLHEVCREMHVEFSATTTVTPTSTGCRSTARSTGRR